MKFLTAFTAIAAAIGSAFAQTSDFHALTRPGMNEEVPAGKIYTVTWDVAEEYEDNKVTISLLGGDSGSTLQPMGTIGSADGGSGSFAWSVDSSLGDEKTYGLVISLSADTRVFQYSTPFSIKGSSTSKSTSTTKKPASTTTTPEPKSTSAKGKTTSERSTSTSTRRTSTSTSTKTSTSSKSSSTSSTSSASTPAPTTLVTVTETRASSSNVPASTSSSSSTTPTATSEPQTGGGIAGISTGAWIGIAAGGIAGVAVLMGMISMVFKLRSHKNQERYQDIDRSY